MLDRRTREVLPPAHPLTCGRAHNGCVLIHSFQKLANDQWDALDSLYFLLGVEEFFLQILLLVFDVLLLDLQELQLLLQLLEAQSKGLSAGLAGQSGGTGAVCDAGPMQYAGSGLGLGF